MRLVVPVGEDDNQFVASIRSVLHHIHSVINTRDCCMLTPLQISFSVVSRAAAKDSGCGLRIESSSRNDDSRSLRDISHSFLLQCFLSWFTASALLLFACRWRAVLCCWLSVCPVARRRAAADRSAGVTVWSERIK